MVGGGRALGPRHAGGWQSSNVLAKRPGMHLDQVWGLGFRVGYLTLCLVSSAMSSLYKLRYPKKR